MSFNKITLYGNLGRDPELRYTPSGSAVCDFSVATTTKTKDGETTTWFKVTAWGKLAERVAQYLTKGSAAMVFGTLTTEEYLSREGEKKTVIKVTADDVRFVGGKVETQDASVTTTPAVEARQSVSARDLTEDIPF